jgi:DNA-directed RNA polymerase subunit RPC12/RpoP
MELFVIRTFQNYFQAHILMTRLRASGLECYLKDEFTVTVDPFLSNALGGIKLVAKRTDEQFALALLQEFDHQYRNSATCPRCGSHRIELLPKNTASNMVTAILSWIFGSYAISAENVYQCGNCGYESPALPENIDVQTNPLNSDQFN